MVSKTKVAPIKRVTIPRLELCGAHLLTQILYHYKEVFIIPVGDIFVWTDSTIVLNWLVGNPRCFKAYVGNRVSHIIGLIPPEYWGHMDGKENPADCVSHGLFPLSFWDTPCGGTDQVGSSIEFRTGPSNRANPAFIEEEEVCLHASVVQNDPIIQIQRFSSYTHAKRVAAWILRFVYN